jgi:prepilin-type N-terminal cleavage/methylation domain-containing protein
MKLSSSKVGFTLLEVMAAVAVLGLVYVVVARVAIQGLQIEGDASRMLRASLLADRALSDLELALAGGDAPRVGETETQEEDFTVVVEVSPFDLGGILPEEAEADRQPAFPPSTLQLLSPTTGGNVPTLLSIVARVSWVEGVSERKVTRTSFVFDAEAAAPLLEGIAELEEEPAREEEPAGGEEQ